MEKILKKRTNNKKNNLNKNNKLRKEKVKKEYELPPILESETNELCLNCQFECKQYKNVNIFWCEKYKKLG